MGTKLTELREMEESIKKIAEETKETPHFDKVQYAFEKGMEFEWKKGKEYKEKAEDVIKHLLWYLRNPTVDSSQYIETTEKFLGRT